jgi:hypothetical protein
VIAQRRLRERVFRKEHPDTLGSINELVQLDSAQHLRCSGWDASLMSGPHGGLLPFEGLNVSAIRALLPAARPKMEFSCKFPKVC